MHFFDQGRSRKIDQNGEKSSHLSGIVIFRLFKMDDVQHTVNYKSLSSDIIRQQWL